MKHWTLGFIFVAALAASRCCLAADVYPTAILNFQERGSGVKGFGAKVRDLLFASLAANPDLYLVERDDLKKALKEQELNLSGAVKSSNAVQV